MTDILTAQHGGENFSEAEPAIRLALNDKSADVRREVYRLLSQCLKKFSYPDLKNHETRLVKHLLYGFSEQSAELREKVCQYLNEGGQARRQLEEQLQGLTN